MPPPIKTLQRKIRGGRYHLQPDPMFPDKDSHAQSLVRPTSSLTRSFYSY